MGKWCLQASSFIFDRIFVKLAVNQGRHKILEVFEFRLDQISHFGVTCPWGQIKFSIDLLWNLQIRRKYTGYLVGATPLTVFHRLFWNFSDVFWMEWRCVCGLNIILCLFFLTFLLCELGLFLVWIAIKVYRQWVPCGSNSSYSFPPIILIHCRCFQHGMKMCMWFGYNTLIIFSHFFYFVNFFWHEMLSKYRDSGYLVDATPATPLTVFLSCFETLQMFSVWNEVVHVALV